MAYNNRNHRMDLDPFSPNQLEAQQQQQERRPADTVDHSLDAFEREAEKFQEYLKSQPKMVIPQNVPLPEYVLLSMKRAQEGVPQRGRYTFAADEDHRDEEMMEF